jgi:hypothetical protein
MMMLSTAVKVYIAADPIDMRKSIDSLSMLVRPMFDQDALSGHVFVFYGRRHDKIKVLVYDHTGFWLMRYALVKNGVSTVRSTTFQASPLMKSNASRELLARIVVAHLAWIRKLYDIQRKLRDADPMERRRVRQLESTPVLRDYQLWLQAKANEVLPKSALGRAIAYSLSNWEALTRYVDDGNLAMDSNLIERAIRRVAIARKNHLFFGSEAGGKAAAVFYSMLATCRANDINPYDYLSEVLGRINDHPINRIEELAPYNWKPSGVAGSASSVASTSSLPVAGSATRH